MIMALILGLAFVVMALFVVMNLWIRTPAV